MQTTIITDEVIGGVPVRVERTMTVPDAPQTPLISDTAGDPDTIRGIVLHTDLTGGGCLDWLKANIPECDIGSGKYWIIPHGDMFAVVREVPREAAFLS